MAELQMDWSDGQMLHTGDFHLPSRPKAETSRSIGKTVGGADIVTPYSDPIWTMMIRLGPVTRAQSKLLRTRVGGIVTVRIDLPERPPGDYPHAELWQNADIEMTLTKSTTAMLGMDISEGDVQVITLQFAESAVP